MIKFYTALAIVFTLAAAEAEAGQGTELSITNGSDTENVVITYFGSYCMNDYGDHNSYPDRLATTIPPGQTISKYVEAQGGFQGCFDPWSYSYFSAAFEGNKAAGCFGYQVADTGDATLGIQMDIPATDPSSNATKGFGDLIFSETKNVDNSSLFKVYLTINPASGRYSEEQETAMLGNCRTKAENDISNGGNNP